MARIRTIHPEQWGDEDFADRTAHARLLYLALHNASDDQGTFEWRPRTLRNLYLPCDSDVRIEPLLQELVDAGLVQRYEADGASFGAIRGFGRRQKPNRPSRGQNPLPENLLDFVSLQGDCVARREDGRWLPPRREPSTNAHGALTEDSPHTPGGLSEDASLEALEGTLTEDSLPTHGALSQPPTTTTRSLSQELDLARERALAIERVAIVMAVRSTSTDEQARLFSAFEIEDFVSEFRPLWEAGFRAHVGGKPVDILELQMAGGAVAELADRVFSSAPEADEERTAESVIDAFRAVHMRLRATECCVAGARSLADGRLGVEEASALVARQIGRLTDLLAGYQCDATEEDKLLSAAVRETHEALMSTDPELCLSTSIEEVDQRIGGGMLADTLTVFVGRSGHGKSSIGLTAAYFAANRGHRTLYVSTDMGTRECSWRLQAIATNTHISKLKDLIRAGDEQMTKRVIEATNLPIRIEPDILSIDRIAALVQAELIAGDPFQLVVLDYIQVLDAPGEKDHEKIAYTVKAAKRLGRSANCAVMAMAQCNKTAAFGTMPRIDNILGSSAIEHQADAIVCFQQGTKEPGWDAHDPGFYPLEFSIDKARSGVPGKLDDKYALGVGTFRVTGRVPKGFVEQGAGR